MSKTEPLVSVVIPTFNRALYLERAMSSVACQTWKNLELIIVDDGSTDNTLELLQKWRSSLESSFRFRWISQKNLGVSSARNTGVQAAEGDWIAFLDSDDEWLPEKIDVQMKTAADNNSSFIYCDEIWMRHSVRVNPKKKHQKQGGNIFLPSARECLIGCSTVVIKKDFFNKFGGFREDFLVCEDYDLWLKITVCTNVDYCSQPLVVRHGGREDQLSLATKCMDYYRVKAIDGILRSVLVKSDDKKELISILENKCEILLAGYLKHNNTKNHAEVLSLQTYWRAAL